MDSPADHSDTSLPVKLGMKPGARVALLHAPDGIEAAFGALPEGAHLQHGLRRGQGADLIVGFVTERAHLARNIGWLVRELPPNGAFWVAWPNRTAGIPTDMTDDAVRDIALPVGLVGAEVCAIDAGWTGLKLVLHQDGRDRA